MRCEKQIRNTAKEATDEIGGIMKYKNINDLTDAIIGAAIKVHRQLGPGFLESVYQAALAYELTKAHIPFEKEKALPVF